MIRLDRVVRLLAVAACGLWMVPWGLEVRGQETAAGADAAKSSPAALTMYADAANYQNKSAFELAAEEWTRFLDRFADDPLASKAQHYLGVCQVQLKQYAKAAETLQKILAKYPKFELLEETYLNLGWCQYSLATAGESKKYGEAAATFGQLASVYPKGKYVDQALFFQAESFFALNQRKEAALAYGKLVTGYPESKLRCDALYALGVTLEEMGEWAQAGKSYDMFLEGCQKSELLTEVRMRKAETVLQTGDAKSAEGMFAEVAGVAGFSSADHALFRQAYCVAQQDRMADAGALYAAVAERFPNSPNAPESLLSAGRCYYRAAKYDEAASPLEKAVAAGGERAVEAAHWLCRIHLRRREPDKALALADQVLPTAGENPFAANLKLDKADALYENQERKPDALNEYLAVYKAHPNHDVAALSLYDAAFAALDLKQFPQAADLAGQFLQVFPDHTLVPDTRYILAECHVQNKEYPQAEAIYRALIDGAKEHPERQLWFVRLGLVLYLQQKYQAAIELLSPLKDQFESPDTKAESLYLIGVCHYQLEQVNEASQSLQQAMAASAAWRQADETLLFLARTQRKMNQLDQALATLDSLLKSFPQSTLLDQVYYHVGEYRYAADQYAEAIPAYDEVIQKYGQSSYVPFALYGKGWSLLKTGQFDQAAASFTTLIDKYPEHQLQDESLFARAMCYRQAKKLAEAIADIEAYLTANPQSPQCADALYERGLAEASAEDHKKAAETFSLLLKEQPAYAAADKVLYELGWAYQGQPDEDAAVNTFAALAEKYPESSLAAEANFHVGESHYGKKEYAEAVNAYEQAAKANNPALVEKVAYKLGWAYYQLKQYRESLGQFEAQLKSHPDGGLAADAWFMKGECLFQLKDYQQALPTFVEAVGREASSPQIDVLRQLHAGQSAGQLEKWQESLGYLSAVIDKYPDSPYLSEAYFERGRARHKLGQLDEAVTDFRQAAERSRGAVGTRAHFMIGEIEFQQKNFDEAIRDFQRDVPLRRGRDGAGRAQLAGQGRFRSRPLFRGADRVGCRPRRPGETDRGCQEVLSIRRRDTPRQRICHQGQGTT